MEYFSKYGKIVDCIIMRDKEIGKSRGFGFVTFETEEAVESVLAEAQQHVLLDKWVDCKKATAKPTMTSKYQPYMQSQSTPYPVRGIFNNNVAQYVSHAWSFL